MLKLKLQSFGHLMQRTDSLEKTLMQGNIEGRRRRGQQRIRWVDGITDFMKFEEVPGVGKGQGSLACCIPWGRKESDTTEQLNNNNKFSIILILLFWVCLCIFKEYYCFTFIFFGCTGQLVGS